MNREELGKAIQAVGEAISDMEAAIVSLEDVNFYVEDEYGENNPDRTQLIEDMKETVKNLRNMREDMNDDIEDM